MIKKISIISPLNNFIDIPSKMIELDNLLLNKYDYEVIFVYDRYLPKELNSSPKYSFVQTKLTATYDEKITIGFEKITGVCALIVDFNQINWKEYLIKMLVEWENGANIVLTKNAPKKINFLHKIFQFFKKIFYSVYNKILSGLEFGKDLNCFDTFQLFDEPVYKIIKEFPEKNLYLRNFDCWIEYKTVILQTEEKIKVNKELKPWSLNLTKFSIFSAIALSYVILMIVSFPLFQAKNAVFTYISMSFLILFMLMFFSLYYLFLHFLQRRTGITKFKG